MKSAGIGIVGMDATYLARNMQDVLGLVLCEPGLNLGSDHAEIHFSARVACQNVREALAAPDARTSAEFQLARGVQLPGCGHPEKFGNLYCSLIGSLV